MAHKIATPVTLALAIALTSAAASSAQSIGSSAASCRYSLARGVRSYATTAAKQIIKCHDARARGDIAGSVDCNDVTNASFPASSVATIDKSRTKLMDTASKCTGTTPAALGYDSCPTPCTSAIPTMTTFSDVAECLACVTAADLDTTATEVFGASPTAGADDAAWQCQRNAAKAFVSYGLKRIKVQQVCRYNVDRGSAATADCKNDDPSGVVGAARAKADARIAKCSDANLARLTSCGSVVASEQSCVTAATEAFADALYDEIYRAVPPTPTPTLTPTATITRTPTATATATSTSAAGSCPSANFLNVSSAPGAGAGYAAPSLNVSCTSTTVTVTSNGIPHYTFVQTTPNALTAGNYVYTFPRSPQVAATTTSIPLLGTIGVSVNGLTLTGPNEAAMPDPYGDPVANAILDECMGHTAPGGNYHYHALLQKCLVQSGLVAEPWLNPDPLGNERSPIIGYAKDGFPIYGPYECTDAGCGTIIEMQSSYNNIGYQSTGCTSSSQCNTNYVCALSMINGVPQNACIPKTYAWNNNQYAAKTGSQWLDKCNGHYGPSGDYHYHATSTFPYILGCYAGTPLS